MPEPVYTSQTPFVEKISSVLVITCSSNAFMPYVSEFLEKQLGLPQGSYDWLAVPGGPQFLLLTEYLPKFAWVGQKWLKFLIERHRLNRLIVISHEDCAWYKEERLLPAFFQKYGVLDKSLKDRQKEDLRAVSAIVRDLVTPIAIEAYYAEKGSDGFVHFTQEA